MTVPLFGGDHRQDLHENVGLKRIADEAANFVRNDFYVDDGLKSVDTVEHATTLIKKTKEMCAKRVPRLRKFISNSKEVISAIPREDCASTLENLDLHSDRLPIERALGVYWCVESDTFQMLITLQDTPLTRRCILSTISSIYDPLGLVAPVLLVEKQLLQKLCREGTNWDDPVPDQIRARWEKWRNELCLLNDFKVRRCFQPKEFGPIKSTELYHFPTQVRLDTDSVRIYV